MPNACPKCGSALQAVTYNAHPRAYAVECIGWNCDFRISVDPALIVRAAMAEFNESQEPAGLDLVTDSQEVAANA